MRAGTFGSIAWQCTSAGICPVALAASAGITRLRKRVERFDQHKSRRPPAPEVRAMRVALPFGYQLVAANDAIAVLCVVLQR